MVLKDSAETASNDLAQNVDKALGLPFNLPKTKRVWLPMPDLIVRPIGADRLSQVYPLIRAGTGISLHRWMEFGLELLAGGGGVIAVTAADECEHGVAVFRSGSNLRHEQCLDVEVIVAFDLHGKDVVRDMLYRELESIAARNGCVAINFTVDAKKAEQSSRTRTGLERLGHKLDTACFVRSLSDHKD